MCRKEISSMYVPFTMTFYKVVVNLNSMFLPPYIKALEKLLGWI